MVFQVSTSTGVKSHYFNLHVMVPTAFILGSDEYHTQAGNAISLVCIIENVSILDREPNCNRRCTTHNVKFIFLKC